MNRDRLRAVREAVHTGLVAQAMAALVVAPALLALLWVPGPWRWIIAFALMLAEGYALGVFLRDEEELDDLPVDEYADEYGYGLTTYGGPGR